MPIGPRFSTGIVTALSSLISSRPSSGKLLIIGTTSSSPVLEDLGIGGDLWDTRLIVPPIMNLQELSTVLYAASQDNFPSGPLITLTNANEIINKLRQIGIESVCIPIKKLLQMIGHASSATEDVSQEFISLINQYQSFHSTSVNK